MYRIDIFGAKKETKISAGDLILAYNYLQYCCHVTLSDEDETLNIFSMNFQITLFKDGSILIRIKDHENTS